MTDSQLPTALATALLAMPTVFTELHFAITARILPRYVMYAKIAEAIVTAHPLPISRFRLFETSFRSIKSSLVPLVFANLRSYKSFLVPRFAKDRPSLISFL